MGAAAMGQDGWGLRCQAADKWETGRCCAMASRDGDSVIARDRDFWKVWQGPFQRPL